MCQSEALSNEVTSEGEIRLFLCQKKIIIDI